MNGKIIGNDFKVLQLRVCMDVAKLGRCEPEGSASLTHALCVVQSISYGEIFSEMTSY